MPYASVYYKGTNRPYTFYTDRDDITAGQKVLVKDRHGFSLCDFCGYVKKPNFLCQVIVASQMEMEEKTEEVRVAMLREDKEAPGDREDEAGNRHG